MEVPENNVDASSEGAVGQEACGKQQSVLLEKPRPSTKEGLEEHEAETQIKSRQVTDKAVANEIDSLFESSKIEKLSGNAELDDCQKEKDIENNPVPVNTVSKSGKSDNGNSSENTNPTMIKLVTHPVKVVYKEKLVENKQDIESIQKRRPDVEQLEITIQKEDEENMEEENSGAKKVKKKGESDIMETQDQNDNKEDKGRRWRLREVKKVSYVEDSYGKLGSRLIIGKAKNQKCNDEQEEVRRSDEQPIGEINPKDKESSKNLEEPCKTDNAADSDSSASDNEKESDGDDEMDCGDTSMNDSDNQSEDCPTFSKRASNDPNFAVVFSFLSLFGSLLNIPEFSLKEFEDGLDNCTDFALDAAQHGLLEKLHLKLLRRLSRSYKTQFSSLAQVSSDRLLKYLIRFSKHYELDLAWDLEKFGYHVLGSSERLLLLKALCEIHFDENPRFKTHFTDEYIKTDNINALRLQPFGRVINGKMIWFQQDNVAGFRIYSVEDDDSDGNTWKLIASTMEELDIFVGTLKKKAEVNPKDIAAAKRKERKEKARQNPTKKIRRRKTKSQLRKERELTDSESDEDDDNPCAYCFSNKRPDLVLLCDLCDAAYHTLCLRPPLMTIPEDDWHCPYCQQNELIELLEVKSKELIGKIKAIERASKRAVFDDIKLSNIMNKGNEADDAHSRRSGRQKKSIDYNFSDFDQMIKDATKGATQTQKDGSNVPVGRFYRAARQRKTRGLTDLDDGFTNSSHSEFDERITGSENENIPAKFEEFVGRGCRRSRRLRKRLGNEEEEESSGEEEGFVRRSTRRRVTTQQKYMEYITDSDTEVTGMDKGKGAKDDEEYEMSEVDDDYEDELRIRTRSVLDDEDVEDDIEETDEEFENEALQEDFRMTVVDEYDSEEDNLSEDEPEYMDETDDDSRESKGDNSDADSEDSGVYRRKKRKRHSGVEEDSDGEKKVKKRGGKDMDNIIKCLEEEKRASKETREVSKRGAQESEEVSPNSEIELHRANVEPEKSEMVSQRSKTESKESEASSKETETSSKELDEYNVLSNGLNVACLASEANKATRREINTTEEKKSNLESHNAINELKQQPTDLKSEQNITEDRERKSDADFSISVLVSKKLTSDGEVEIKEEFPTQEHSSDLLEQETLSPIRDSLSPEMGVFPNKEKSSMLRNQKVSSSPVIDDLINTELTERGEELSVDAVNTLKQTTTSSPQKTDPSSFLKTTEGPQYPHDPFRAGNPLLPRPDMIPISQIDRMSELYRARPIPSEFDYYATQQHPGPFPRMQNPYAIHSPQAYFGGRSEHFPTHVQHMARSNQPVNSMARDASPTQPMVMAGQPMSRGNQPVKPMARGASPSLSVATRGLPPYQGQHGIPGYGSLPGQAIWRPQEAGSPGWGSSPQLSSFPARTKMPTSGYPSYRGPDINLKSSGYGAPPVVGSTAADGVKNTTTPWKTGGRNAPHRPSTSESYAAFQSMVITPSGEGEQKKSKKQNSRA